MNNRPLQNQVALVTGAGRRIGRVIALTLARAGADVVVHYNESKQGALATAREIESLGSQAMVARADVSRPKQVAALFRSVEKRFGRLDLLVNNAGIFFPATWDQLREKDWDKILGINRRRRFSALRQQRASCNAKGTAGLLSSLLWGGFRPGRNTFTTVPRRRARYHSRAPWRKRSRRVVNVLGGGFDSRDIHPIQSPTRLPPPDRAGLLIVMYTFPSPLHRHLPR